MASRSRFGCPDAQIPALQAAAESGIKIMQYNSGLPVKADIGAINYFGSDEYAKPASAAASIWPNKAQPTSSATFRCLARST